MEPEATGERSHAGRWALWVSVALVVYVLSIGPVNSYVRRHDGIGTTWNRLRIFYAPLRWFENYPPVADPLVAYECWWDGTSRPPGNLYPPPSVYYLFAKPSLTMFGTGTLILDERVK